MSSISICSLSCWCLMSCSHIFLFSVLLFHLSLQTVTLLVSNLAMTSSQFLAVLMRVPWYLDWSNEQLSVLFPLSCSCRTFSRNLALCSQEGRSYLNSVKYHALISTALCFYFLELMKALLAYASTFYQLISSSMESYSLMISYTDLPSS